MPKVTRKRVTKKEESTKTNTTRKSVTKKEEPTKTTTTRKRTPKKERLVFPETLGSEKDETGKGQFESVWALEFAIDLPGYPNWVAKPYGKTKKEAYVCFMEWALKWYSNITQKQLKQSDIIIHSLIPMDDYLKEKN